MHHFAKVYDLTAPPETAWRTAVSVPVLLKHLSTQFRSNMKCYTTKKEYNMLLNMCRFFFSWGMTIYHHAEQQSRMGHVAFCFKDLASKKENTVAVMVIGGSSTQEITGPPNGGNTTPLDRSWSTRAVAWSWQRGKRLRESGTIIRGEASTDKTGTGIRMATLWRVLLPMEPLVLLASVEPSCCEYCLETSASRSYND